MAEAEALAAAMKSMASHFALQTVLSSIPSFDGKTPELRIFAQQIERGRAQVPTIPEAEFVHAVQNKLIGPAWEAAEGCTFVTLKELIEHLRKNSAQEGLSARQYLAELGRVKMGRDESVIDYGARVKNIVRGIKAALICKYTAVEILAQMALINDQARDNFIKGLRGSIEIRVSNARPATLDEAITCAREEHQRVKELAEHHGWNTSRETSPARIQTPLAFRPSRDPNAEENRPFLQRRNPANPSSSHGYRQTGTTSLMTRDSVSVPKESVTGNRSRAEFMSDDVCYPSVPTHCPHCQNDIREYLYRSLNCVSQEGVSNPFIQREPKSSLAGTPISASTDSDKFTQHLNVMRARQTVESTSAGLDATTPPTSTQTRIVRAATLSKILRKKP